jgi:hypothetical protein
LGSALDRLIPINLMRKYIFIAVIWVFFDITLIGAARLLSAQSSKVGDTSIIEQLSKVEYSDWQAKDKVLKDILSQKSILSEIEKDKLIEIFEQESRFEEDYVDRLRKQGVSLNDAIDKFDTEYRQKGYGNYFVEFAILISSFKNTKLIPSLLRAYYYYGGAIGPTIIIGMGEDAIEPLLECLNSKDRVVRDTSYEVLCGWVNAPVKAEDYTITRDMVIKDKRTLERIKVLFLKALSDKDIDVRSAAVEGLGAFPDEGVIKSLEEVAQHDPHSYYSKYEKKMKYPIREDAVKTIEIIKTKMKNRTETK